MWFNIAFAVTVLALKLSLSGTSPTTPTRARNVNAAGNHRSPTRVGCAWCAGTSSGTAKRMTGFGMAKTTQVWDSPGGVIIPAPDCTCGHPYIVHDLNPKNIRTRCTVGTYQRCGCAVPLQTLRGATEVMTARPM